MQPSHELQLITVDDLSVDGEKGLFSAVKTASARVAALDPGVLAGNLSALCDQLSQVVDATIRTTGAYELESFEVSLDVSAAGEVRLVGSVSSEVKGGLKLVFRRRSA